MYPSIIKNYKQIVKYQNDLEFKTAIKRNRPCTQTRRYRVVTPPSMRAVAEEQASSLCTRAKEQVPIRRWDRAGAARN